MDPDRTEIETLRREVERLTLELAAARDEARTTAQTKSAFLANMSHELRTPLNAILGYAELLREDAADVGAPQLMPDLEKISTSASHLLALINDILDLARIEAGRAAVYPEPIDVIDLCEDALRAVTGLAEEHGNQLVLDRSPEATLLISDRRKALQCLVNLLSNAAKFTERGTITFEAERTSNGAAFTVRDTGIGIAPDQIEQIFQEFHQVDGSTTRRHGGSGLGLTITRKLTGLLGGELVVHSELGRGSTFRLVLPDLSLSATTDPTPTRTRAPNTLPPPDPKTVLVVDDDPGMRALIRRYLETEGYKVVEAKNGAEGVRYAELHRPGVICLDAVMPEMDGWSTLRVFKERDSTREIPVVMVTLIDDRSRGFVLGASEYLVKPIRKDVLLATLARVRGEPRGPILVVDDDRMTREMVVRMLTSEGHEVVEAENGRVALERIRERVPSLVILDLMMPELDGFQVVAEVRRTPAWADLPIVVVTAMDIPPMQRKTLERQVQGLIGKGGHDKQLLVEEVRRAVTTRTAG